MNPLHCDVSELDIDCLPFCCSVAQVSPAQFIDISELEELFRRAEVCNYKALVFTFTKNESTRRRNLIEVLTSVPGATVCIAPRKKSSEYLSIVIVPVNF